MWHTYLLSIKVSIFPYANEMDKSSYISGKPIKKAIKWYYDIRNRTTIVAVPDKFLQSFLCKCPVWRADSSTVLSVWWTTVSKALASQQYQCYHVVAYILPFHSMSFFAKLIEYNQIYSNYCQVKSAKIEISPPQKAWPILKTSISQKLDVTAVLPTPPITM